MKIQRRFTRMNAEKNVFDTVEWTKRTSRITNADGSLVFEMNDAEVPASWSQLATDIMVSKYFRKAGVPQMRADGAIETDARGDAVTGPERSARQVIHRLAGCWRHWGEQNGYFDTRGDADAFEDELSHMMLHQMAAPNSPQWFNTGLNWAYGISGPPQGHWINDTVANRLDGAKQTLADDAYTHPQPHACFIQSCHDDLVNDGGIMDLWVREARLFKYGSGTGTNFSSLRGENEALSGGGRSSGLMSFLKIGDRAAGAIKSGGTTRRAAKMVCLDADHPDIESFVNWKVREELKVAAMVEGLKRLPEDQKETAERLDLRLDYDFNGEAYYTVSGQNSNNSVRLTDAFFRAVDNDDDWHLTGRINGEVMKTVKARDLWGQISYAAWRCADPGLQYDTTINAWHTCPGNGRINASNPCSEYMFLDNTACNLASINLLEFYDAEQRTFDLESFEHAIELWTIVLEISVLMAAFPSREIARESHRFRTLGLGYANLGAMLMQAGIPYDSDEGRAICGAITSVLTGRSYATSARMSSELGAFPGYEENREDMLRVIRNHRRAAHGVDRTSDEWEDLSIRPVPIDHDLLRDGTLRLRNGGMLLDGATLAWDEALALGERFGYRNAQVSVIAPTGTIGLLMDCDTTGVEPDFALVKFKKLAGGGYFKIANASLRPALQALGYTETERDTIVRHVMGALSVEVPMPAGSSAGAPGEPTEASESTDGTFRGFLEATGYTTDEIVDLENLLPTIFELPHAFTAWSMPVHVLESVGVDPEQAKQDTSFNGLRALGLDLDVIAALNRTICGTQTVEGAPFLRPEHLAVFDCANTCGPLGKRFIRTEGHIRMMAASQPFISGAISKTINLPADATVEDVASSYRLSWELGLKANALYRDGSKLSQPLNTSSEETLSEDDSDADDVTTALAEVAGDVVHVAETAAAAPEIAAREPEYVERIVERIIERPMRRRLPDTRSSLTHRFNVAGHEGYLTVGLYDDGTPGELFITMSKEGSTIGGLMDSLGTAISVALQYGVPIESLVNKFAHQRFEPMGMTANRDVPFAKSLVDYIFRWMGMEFIPGYREANAPPRKKEPARATESDKRDHVMEDKRWSRKDQGRGTEGTSRMASVSRLSSEATPGAAPGDATAGAKTGEPSSEGGPTDDRGRGRTDDPSHATHASQVATGAASIVSVTDVVAEVGGTTGEIQVTARHVLDQSNAAMQSDAPACDVCGAITVRNGTCYRCLNCGNSMGCS